jgi:NTP pyrophosphatase (non-canonical NTP hydrolase)
MDFRQLLCKALEVRQKYKEFEEKKYGGAWSIYEIAMGLASDVGDIIRLVMAHNGRRDIPDVKLKLTNELADCLWSLIVLSDELNIDLEVAFLKTMDELSDQISKGVLKKPS